MTYDGQSGYPLQTGRRRPRPAIGAHAAARQGAGAQLLRAAAREAEVGRTRREGVSHADVSTDSPAVHCGRSRGRGSRGPVTTANRDQPAASMSSTPANIRGLDPKLFNFTREELKEVDFVNTAYLIVHPKGTLDVRHRRCSRQPLQGGRRSGQRGDHVRQPAAEAAAGGGGLLTSRRHVPRAVALSLRSHRQRERLRVGDLDRPEGRARLHVERQAAGHHPA